MTRTVESRLEIGFPSEAGDWNRAPAVYDEHSLRIAGHPVMEDWETEYMRVLADICAGRGGAVLEVGYGMGISTRMIREHAIEEHYIIECHPEVASRCIRDFRPAIEEGRLHVLTGFWQDVVLLLKAELFDGILFDTYPLCAGEIHRNHYPFFPHAQRLLRPGGVFTYYSDEESAFSPAHLEHLRDAGFDDAAIDYRRCPVNPPAECAYWQKRTLLAPVIRKRLE